MIFRDLIQTGARMANANAPALLTAFGAVGTVTTAVLAGKASFEAARRIDEAQRYHNLEEKSHDFTKTEKVKLVWPLYIPAAVSGTTTVGAIILSHRVSSRRAAALAAAYALSEGRLEEYQDKVKEKFGIKKEKEARDEIVQQRVTKDHESGLYSFDPSAGKVWIKDAYSGRPFLGSIEDVNRAVNEINREIINSVGSSASLSDFYDLVGLEHVSTSDYFGWNTDELCEIDWSTATTPDGRIAVHVFEFVNPPVLNPDRRSSFR